MTQPANAPPPGSQITGDYQYEYRGLLVGSGTDFVTSKWTGLLGQPPIVQYHSKAVAKHGVYYGYEVFDARTVAFDCNMHSDGVNWLAGRNQTPGEIVEAMIGMLNEAFTIPRVFANEITIPLDSSDIDDPLVVKRPGKKPRQLFCHTTKRDTPADGDVATGLAVGSLELYAGDPLFYSLESYDVSSSIPDGDVTTPSFFARNNGGFPSARCQITIGGPGGDGDGEELWTINNITYGQSIRLDMTLGDDDVVVIDLFFKTITLNGDNMYSFRRSDSSWWALQPGDNEITVTRHTSDGVASNVSLSYLDAWDSA